MNDMPDQTATTTTPPSEDAFFILKDCRELFQRRLVEIAGQAGIVSPLVINAFSQEVGEAHDELASSAKQDGFEQTAGLTASRISLVGNDDLELEIRIGEIANRLRGNERIEHWRVQLRYMTLLNRPKMSAENNPLGLEPIARGLWAICRRGDGPLDRKLDRLDRLEEMLALKLPELYIELNELLQRHGVEPTQVRVVQRAGSGLAGPGQGGVSSGTGSQRGVGSGSGGGGGFAGQGNPNALSALQATLRQQFETDEFSVTGFGSGNTSGDGGGHFTINASTLVMLTHLMERLSALEHQQAAALHGHSPDDAAGPLPLRTLKAKDLDLPLGKPAAVALDTLSLIFEGIFAAPDLPDVVKAVIGRLQIPLLKLAILDASFFANNQHPGRQLVNRMARAAVGLEPDTGREHPICVSLGKLADAVRATLERNDGDLTPHLQELETLITARDQSVHNAAQPYLQLVLHHEADESFRISADEWLKKTLGKTNPVVAHHVASFWQRILPLAGRDGGIDGPRWKEATATAEDLLWSIVPKQTPEERKQLVALIPTLIKRINGALDTLNVSREERTPFLNACFDLQTAALRGRPDMPAAPQAEEQPPASGAIEFDTGRASAASAPPEDQILQTGGTIVHYLGQPSVKPSPWRSGGSAWKEGDWLFFALPDGERLCGRHCGKSSPAETVVLFNPEWGYAVALAPAQLEKQLRSGEARIASDQMLFDLAAERALGQIKPG